MLLDRAAVDGLIASVSSTLMRHTSANRHDVSNLVGSADAMELIDLKNEDKIVVEQGRIHVDREALLGVLSRFDDQREQQELTILYVLHELAHRQTQGIGDKRDVVGLRRAGAEDSLLRLDLAADHLAALLGCQLLPHHSLASLKELQGRSLSAFPVKGEHTPEARKRKARRLVSLRADHQLHAAGQLSAQDGYVYVDFSHSALAVLTSAPLERLFAWVDLTAGDALVLIGAADEGSRLLLVDAVLRKVLPCRPRAA